LREVWTEQRLGGTTIDEYERVLCKPRPLQPRSDDDLRPHDELARGVDPVTVQAWMGHASISTTNLYLHHLGTSADRSGLARLNERGHA
jgi:integrase